MILVSERDGKMNGVRIIHRHGKPGDDWWVATSESHEEPMAVRGASGVLQRKGFRLVAGPYPNWAQAYDDIISEPDSPAGGAIWVTSMVLGMFVVLVGWGAWVVWSAVT